MTEGHQRRYNRLVRRRRDHLAALGLVSALVWLSVAASRNPTFRFFFRWPDGATWSNMLASAEWVALVAFLAWYFRGLTGPALAGWWNKHRAAHHEEHHQATRDHITAELAKMELRLLEKLTSRGD